MGWLVGCKLRQLLAGDTSAVLYSLKDTPLAIAVTMRAAPPFKEANYVTIQRDEPKGFLF